MEHQLGLVCVGHLSIQIKNMNKLLKLFLSFLGVGLVSAAAWFAFPSDKLTISAADINSSQDYDVIHTLTFAAGSGTCKIRLYRGSPSAYTGTVYYRAGTSGAWTELSVSGTDTTFPVSATTMQIGHDNNKSGNDYMTASFYGQATNLIGIAISQKAVFSGTMGNYFMYVYAVDCSALTSLAVPDTSGLTSVGTYFMYRYAGDCTALTSLAVPDTSGLTSVGDNFMYYYAYGCTALLRLELPATGWFVGHNIDWRVPSGRLNYLKGYVGNATDLTAWQALTASGKTLYLNYVRSADNIILE